MTSKSEKFIGILGSGQLALMLGEAAVRMGVPIGIFAGSEQDPAVRICPKPTLGSTSDLLALQNFFKQHKRIIFENEFLDCDLLLQASQGLDVTFLPGIEVIRLLQDKLNQKYLLRELGIPHAPFIELRSRSDLGLALKQFPMGCVLKWAKMGYDGKGVLVLTQQEYETDLSLQERVQSFFQQAEQFGSRIYAEQKITFKRELAILGVRAIHGEFKAYPLVVSEQVSGICSLVYGPATREGVSTSLQILAEQWAKSLAEWTQTVGVFAIECFETQEGTLLVNEIAPRVHNSGHYSQDAGMTDQFENHLRAVMGFPLGQTQGKAAFAMLNLLGPLGLSCAADVLPVATGVVQLHWYGKKEMRLGRKMGHLNACAQGLESKALILELKTCAEAWLKQVEKRKAV